MGFFDNLRAGFETSKTFFRGQRAVHEAAVKAWKGKALWCEVKDSKEYFSKKHLKKQNAEDLLKAFKFKHSSEGALLFRKKINYSPDACAAFLSKSLENVKFIVVER